VVYNGSLAGAAGDVELDYFPGVGGTNGTPEPATDLLLGGAIIGLSLFRKRFVRQ
jgi:hypothetical protein